MSHELRYEELQRQGNLRTSMEIQRRLSQKNSAKRNNVQQSSESKNPTHSTSQPRYPILDTSEIQQRSQSIAASRSTRRSRPPPSPPPSPTASSRSRRGQTTTTRPILNRNYSRSHHNNKSKPKAKLSNLYGVIDTNKLKLLCGDYYSEDYSASTRSTIHLDPIPETEPSAPPYDGSPYETAPSIAQSPAIPIGDNPYQTHSK